jgi:hypothetical protein
VLNYCPPLSQRQSRERAAESKGKGSEYEKEEYQELGIQLALNKYKFLQVSKKKPLQRENEKQPGIQKVLPKCWFFSQEKGQRR